MDRLQGPRAQVVLEIKEGKGFSFVSNGLIIIASFRGTSLESEEIPPSSRPKFESTLIWEIETKYLRKLRSSNTALKVEFFFTSKSSTQPTHEDRIGNVLLNLKEAKIAPLESSNKNDIGSWYRLLNLKGTLNAHKPEVFLSFRIQDLKEMDHVNEKTKKLPDRVHRLEDPEVGVGMVDSSTGDERTEIKAIQIGPPPLCTELYQLSISFIAVDNLLNIMPPDKLGQAFKIHFTIFGSSILTEEMPSTLDNGVYGEKVTFDIWSRIEFLSAYFKEFPTLALSIFCDNDLIGTANMNLQVLSNLTTKKNIAMTSTLVINSVAYHHDAQLRIPEAVATLQVGLDLILKSDCISTKIDQEIQTNQKSSERKVDAVTNTEEADHRDLPPCNHDGSYQSGHTLHNKSNPVHIEDFESENTSFRSLKPSPSAKTKEPLRESSEFVLQSPPNTFRFSNSSLNHPMDLSKEYVRNAAIRACEELEDWKEKQQQMFEFELKRKTDRRLKKLSNEWTKHRRELEDDLKQKINDCQNLKQKLTEAFEDLTARCEIVAQREQELEIAKEELDKKYTMKFQELRKASRLCEYDMEDKINIIKSENADLQKKLEESGKEILRLQQTILNQGSATVPKEEASDLLNEVKSLERQLEKALESKNFFKEQWGKAVRELHRMKEEEQQQLKMQIQKNRQELQTLGLVKEISEEVGEMKKDQFVIKNIRNELSNFFPSNDPILDVNCFSGT